MYRYFAKLSHKLSVQGSPQQIKGDQNQQSADIVKLQHSTVTPATGVIAVKHRLYNQEKARYEGRGYPHRLRPALNTNHNRTGNDKGKYHCPLYPCRLTTSAPGSQLNNIGSQGLSGQGSGQGQ